GGAGVDSRGRADVVGVVARHGDRLAVAQRVRRGGVGGRADRPGAGDRVHAQGREDALSDEVVPALAGDGRDDLAGGQDEVILVAEGAAEAGGRLQEAQAAQDFGAVVG